MGHQQRAFGVPAENQNYGNGAENIESLVAHATFMNG